MTVERVRSLEFNGTTYILPESTEIEVKFKALDGSIHNTPQEAEEANDRRRLKDIIYECVSGYDCEVDVNEFIANRAEIIAILSKYP